MSQLLDDSRHRPVVFETRAEQNTHGLRRPARLLAGSTLVLAALAGAVGLALGGSAVWSVVETKAPNNAPAPLWIAPPTHVGKGATEDRVAEERAAQQRTSEQRKAEDRLTHDVVTTSGHGRPATSSTQSGHGTTATTKGEPEPGDTDRGGASRGGSGTSGGTGSGATNSGGGTSGGGATISGSSSGGGSGGGKGSSGGSGGSSGGRSGNDG